MQPRIRRNYFSSKITQVVFAVACLLLGAVSALATPHVSRVLIKPDVKREHRDELTSRLRVITGLTRLRFEDDGSLRLEGEQQNNSSESARSLLHKAVEGENVIIIEDASARADVAFCRVVPGRWVHTDATKPPVYVVLIDFKDFQRLSGDAEARAAFNVGWGLLHEVDHVVTGAEDSQEIESAGQCEDHINQMRLEVGLPVRANYFFSRVPLNTDANFNARYVRLSFERRDTLSLKTKRYWLVWDAVAVGGLLGDSQRALVR